MTSQPNSFQPPAGAGRVSSVALAIPAYNEADGIAGFLTDMDAVLDACSGQHWFVVVNDVSTDDTAEVLTAYGEQAGADPTRWRFGRFTSEQTADLAISAGMPVAKDEAGTIVHALRLLVLGKDGRLIERYDDNDWSLDRVVTQLKTGGPPAPKGTASTLSPRDEVAPE